VRFLQVVAPAALDAAAIWWVAVFLVAFIGIKIIDTVRPPVVGAAGGIPIIGTQLAQFATFAFAAGRRGLYVLLQAGLVSFSNTVAWLQATWAQLTSTVTGFGDLAATAIWKVQFLVIPLALNQALSAASALAATVRADLGALIVASQSAAMAAVADARAAAVALFQTAEADTVNLFQLAEHDAQIAANLVAADAAALVNAERAFTVGAVAVVEADAQAMFQKALAISAAAEAALQGDLGAVAGKLARDLEGGVSALEKEIAAAREVINSIATGALAGVIADVVAIKALKCIQQCGPLGALGEGLSLLDLAAILALVEAARSDPKAAQRFMSDNLVPLVEGVTKSL
jgi:hypothetical protein